jgi:hypothetical protein
MPSPPCRQILLDGAQNQTTGRLGCDLHLAPLQERPAPTRKHSSASSLTQHGLRFTPPEAPHL